MAGDPGSPEKSGSGRDYEVGHCKPPKHTQFGQPGANRSGNGRPRGASITAAILRELAKNPDEDGIGAKAGEIGKVIVQALEGMDTEKGAALLKSVLDRVEGPVKQEIDATVRTDVTNLHLGASPTNPPPMPGGEDDAGGG